MIDSLEYMKLDRKIKNIEISSDTRTGKKTSPMVKSSIETPWRVTIRRVVGRFLLKIPNQSGNIEWGIMVPLSINNAVSRVIDVNWALLEELNTIPIERPIEVKRTI